MLKANSLILSHPRQVSGHSRRWFVVLLKNAPLLPSFAFCNHKLTDHSLPLDGLIHIWKLSEQKLPPVVGMGQHPDDFQNVEDWVIASTLNRYVQMT